MPLLADTSALDTDNALLPLEAEARQHRAAKRTPLSHVDVANAKEQAIHAAPYLHACARATASARLNRGTLTPSSTARCCKGQRPSEAHTQRDASQLQRSRTS